MTLGASMDTMSSWLDIGRLVWPRKTTELHGNCTWTILFSMNVLDPRHIMFECDAFDHVLISCILPWEISRLQSCWSRLIEHKRRRKGSIQHGGHWHGTSPKQSLILWQRGWQISRIDSAVQCERHRDMQMWNIGRYSPHVLDTCGGEYPVFRAFRGTEQDRFGVKAKGENIRVPESCLGILDVATSGVMRVVHQSCWAPSSTAQHSYVGQLTKQVTTLPYGPQIACPSCTTSPLSASLCQNVYNVNTKRNLGLKALLGNDT